MKTEALLNLMGSVKIEFVAVSDDEYESLLQGIRIKDKEEVCE